MNFSKRCPRCGEGKLLSWQELDAEHQEIVRRLPAPAEEKPAEREARHRWCPRCWYETRSDTEALA